MASLSNAVSNGKLALKQREAKKVIDRSAQVVTEDSLAQIHRNAQTLKSMYDQCLSDPETASLVQKLRDLKRSGRANHLHEKELDSEVQRIIEMERKANDQIANSTREIESFSSKLTGTNIQIQS
jgi:site-specific recombinase